MAYSIQEKETHVENICERVSEGRSLLEVIEADKNLPTRDTFYKWVLASAEFSERYARACILRAEKEYEAILLIADENTNDFYIDEETGKEKVNHENIQRSRLRVDTRKWWLSKCVPKIYGDKVQLELNPNINQTNKLFDTTILKPDTLALIERDILENEKVKLKENNITDITDMQ